MDRTSNGTARVTCADEAWHQRRRRLAIVRPPIDFEAARLRKLQEKARQTGDP
jgi:hypothetical protein